MSAKVCPAVKLSSYPDAEFNAAFVPEENIIVGNVSPLMVRQVVKPIARGVAGERFCVRNSGANAVVEGVGDHGCEYMTGGRAVILGRTGRNFAAGMSGGIAYVFDEDGQFLQRCNQAMVDVSLLAAAKDEAEVLNLITKHRDATSSKKAAMLIADWEEAKKRIYKVMPKDYRRMLEAIAAAQASGLTGEAAILAAFENNTRNA